MSKTKSGPYVFRLRKLSLFTQENFAKKIGLNRSYISQLENNNVDISLSKFIDWCEIFEISPVEIFDEDNWK